MLEFQEYIHNIRKEAIKKIEKYLVKTEIIIGLEIGAGDGYQSRIIVDYLKKLMVTELSKSRLKTVRDKRIEYFICDAEKLGSKFNNDQFDLIFSSHLIEHLPNPEKMMHSCYNLINENGLVIHVVPSCWYAFFRLLFWYPSIFVRYKYRQHKNNKIDLFKLKNPIINNNLKVKYKPRLKIFEILLPRPHGVSIGIIREIWDLRKKRWKNFFIKNKFDVIEIINGSCFSGYGFGLEKSKKILSKAGIASEYIYILRKLRNE